MVGVFNIIDYSMHIRLRHSFLPCVQRANQSSMVFQGRVGFMIWGHPRRIDQDSLFFIKWCSDEELSTIGTRTKVRCSTILVLNRKDSDSNSAFKNVRYCSHQVNVTWILARLQNRHWLVDTRLQAADDKTRRGTELLGPKVGRAGKRKLM
ncbi:hypothetical protein AC249_AIPGENE21231 [Exaiptasia diaphana]|nr:hypothetical protein AC249_AIPGENE21231 [Exaiptasia diaphana]